MPTTFAVIGSGGWGTAIALSLALNPDHRVRLWSAHEQSGRALREHRENRPLLPGVPIPADILLTTDPAEAIADADCWVTAVPAAFLRETLARFRSFAPVQVPVVSLTKGIEVATFCRPSRIIEQVLSPAAGVVALSGPSHAEEVVVGLPTSLVAASPDLALATRVQERFTTPTLRIYTNSDLIGVELAGAFKNVIGIAAGICDGLGFGDNAKAALLTRGLVEMTRFGSAQGADPETFAGLAGMGDLIATAFSPHGRNRRLGYRLARGESLPELLQSPQVAEGVLTSRSVHERAVATGLDAPIMSAVYRVLHEGHNPRAAVRELLTRPLTSETR